MIISIFLETSVLRIVRRTYPDRTLNYVGGEGQLRLIHEAAIPRTLRCSLFFLAGSAGSGYAPHSRFPCDQESQRIFPRKYSRCLNACLLDYSDILNALNFLGLADKTMLMLHGNANDLSGWRSRNPLRRYFDLRSTMERYSRQNGTTLALEDRIVH